ncbi:MAG: hypothetical protein M9907_15325 [Burkholderiaceae bacterium]|nr:hypothetical protein [Burkholderiaceae bacterium]
MSSTNSNPPPTNKGGRPRKIDVQILRRKLLDKCERYLEETALPDLSASMIKSIADVVSTIGPEFAKEDRASNPAKVPQGLALPFPAPSDVPQGVIPPRSAATPPAGYPEIPVPSVHSKGGIKASPPPAA